MEVERNDGEKMDEVMLPGFRFHPTDEELVGFYLRRKIQQRPLPIELIKQLDIYKYDPWDLPKLATGEKEWYFYCPRDRKYRNSTRPNRVTSAGFWKATGTDRPIYSSEGANKCIGLKKSLVFYRGRATKGIKTDWMMHEFRLPSLTDSAPSKKFMDKTNIPAKDSWAICRIFEKANSPAQRALSHSFVSSLLPETTSSSADIPNRGSRNSTHQFSSSDNMTSTTKYTTSSSHFNHENDIQKYPFSPLDHFGSYSPINPIKAAPTGKYDPHQLPISHGDLTSCLTFAPLDVSSMLLNMSSSILEDYGANKASDSESIDDHFGGSNGLISMSNFPNEILQGNIGNYNYGDQDHDNALVIKNYPNVSMNDAVDDQWEGIRSINGFPFSNLPMSVGDALKYNSSSLLWDSSSTLPTRDHHLCPEVFPQPSVTLDR